MKRIVYYITENDLNDRVSRGRHLTAEELDRFEEAFPNTTVDQCIDACLDSIVEPDERDPDVPWTHDRTRDET